jgi:NAD(P)-dependent dehydrogenase (short-subunit alcohol dehydrogenase family)
MRHTNFTLEKRMNDHSSKPAALVVGAGRGLGRAIALELARHDYRIAAASRTLSELEQVAVSIVAQGGQAIAIKADATQPHDVAQLVESVLKTFGQIDVLVNCAGEALIKPTPEYTDDDFQRIITSNLTSTFLTCRAVMSHMIQRQSGHIVNVASRAGIYPAPNIAAYAAAKAGVIALSKSLALELKPHNVKVSCLAPSPMNTPMRWAATPNWDRTKVIEPESVAQLVALMLAHPDMTLEEVWPVSPRA